MMDGFIGAEFTVELLHDTMGMGQRGGVISQNAIALCTYVEKTKMCLRKTCQSLRDQNRQFVKTRC